MANLVQFSVLVLHQTENIRSTQVFDAGIIKTCFASWNNSLIELQEIFRITVAQLFSICRL